MKPGNEELFPHLQKFKDLEAQRRPVPFHTRETKGGENHVFGKW